jgi:cytochrome P450
MTMASQTAGSILSFLLAMVHKPEVQRKAQAEIDAVIGEDRTPNWDDWDDLPYIRQIQKEVLR